MDYSRLDLRSMFADGWALFRSRTGEFLIAGLVAAAVFAVSASILAGPALAWLLLTARRFSQNRLALPGETLFTVFRLQPILAGIAWFAIALLSHGIVVAARTLPLGGLLALALLALAPAPFWATAFVVFRGDTAWEAYVSLWNRIVRERFWIPYAVSFLPVLVFGIGAALGGIGAILTAPIGACLFQKLYEQAFADEPDVEILP